MARIRTVKPQFFTNEKLCTLPPATHLLAAGLLTYADDEGYFNANPKLIDAAIFPLRDSLSVPGMLTELEGIGWIRLGEAADGRVYGHIVSFKDHQRINRPTPSKIRELTIAWRTQQHLTEDSLPEGNKEGNKEKEEGTRKRGAHALPDDFVLSPAILDWCKASGYDHPQASLDYMRDWAKSNDKRKADWEATLRNCIKGDWGDARKKARERGPGAAPKAPPRHKCAKCGDPCHGREWKGNLYCDKHWTELYQADGDAKRAAALRSAA